jgi:membrane-associated phospholipid phosphatase
MSEKTNWSMVSKLTLIVLVSWIILAIIFGIYDLNISIAVVDENSTWGDFGNVYGELPGWALGGIALATFFGGYIKNLKLQKTPALLIIALGMLLLIFDESFYVGFSLIISIIIYTIITWNKDWKNYRTLASIIVLLAVINPLLFVETTKILCGRIRFRNLDPGFTNFTPWFLPPGISGGGKSFPSGHTAGGWMLLPLLIVVKDREIKDPYRIVVTVLVIGWGLFVGLSRIVVGAHYASDVLFSTGMAAIVTILLYKKSYLKRK